LQISRLRAPLKCEAVAKAAAGAFAAEGREDII
jgi:hypothetical protein